MRTAVGFRSVQRADGSLPGRLSADWTPAVGWVCLTGLSQIAESWFYLFEVTGERSYLEAGRKANAYVRCTIHIGGAPDTSGGVKGAFSVAGAYGALAFLTLADKFSINYPQDEQQMRTGK